MKIKVFTLALLLIAGTAVSQNIRISANMILESNTVLYVDGDMHIENGKLHLDAGSTLKLSNGKSLSVNNGGNISLKGNDDEQAIITSAGYFIFILKTGATIGAEYATFEKMSGDGLNIQQGALIDPDFPLHNSTFRHGAPVSTFLTINNSQMLNIDGVSFIKTGSEAYNVAKTENTGEIYFSNFSEAL
jgi:hypothetical protein